MTPPSFPESPYKPLVNKLINLAGTIAIGLIIALLINAVSLALVANSSC